jgi:hypothetical protein
LSISTKAARNIHFTTYLPDLGATNIRGMSIAKLVHLHRVVDRFWYWDHQVGSFWDAAERAS